MDKSISIIIPCYNEEQGIKSTVFEILEAFSNNSIKYEIIIVDDCSTDSTNKIAQDLSKSIDHLRVIANDRNLGFCNSYMKGVRASIMHYCLYVPGDNDLKASELCKILKEIGTSDIIVTSFKNIKSRTLHRRILSQSYTKIINYISGKNFNYYNGFNVYKVEEIKKIQLITQGFSFQANLLLDLVNSNLTIKEIEINCAFNDSNSSALRLKNISQVTLFIYKLFLRYRFGIAT